MKNICVVTGGGSGMGLETAKIVGKDQMIVLVGRTVAKLENALNELKELGIEAVAFPGDASNKESVQKLVDYASSLGTIKTVIHAAGVSPHMDNGNKIFKINAIGTINIDEAFGAVMGEGSVILNVSSMSAYMLPAERTPYQIYELGLNSTEALEGAFAQMLAQIPEQAQTGMAYTISKNFVVWFTEKEAIKFGKKGIRVCSISPGTFATPMGDVEGEEAAGFAKRGALGRVGDPKEIAQMMAFMVSDQASYLTGVDILYDGGAIAAHKDMISKKQA